MPHSADSSSHRGHPPAPPNRPAPSEAPVQIVVLRSDEAQAELRPDLGGALMGLWFRRQAVLRNGDARAATMARQASCLPTVPFAHRLGHRALRWQGRDFRLAASTDGAVHSAYGVGWQKPWHVSAVDARGAIFRYVHQPDAGWPFAFEAVQTFELTDTSLKAHLQLINRDSQVQPLGIGWRMVLSKRARARLHLESRERWVFDPQTRLPLARELNGGMDGDLRWMDGDQAYEGVTGAVRVRDEKLSLKLHSSLTRVAVAAFEARSDWSLQWMSHAPNALQMLQPDAHGVPSVAPGAWIEGWMKIDLDTA